MKNYTHNYKYFNGYEISQEEIENGYINYRTLAKGFSLVLCNDIAKLFYNTINGEYIEPEIINGYDYDNENEEYIDIFQYYIIDSRDAEILQDRTNEIVYYVDYLDLYIWGVTHYGTPWNGVNTEIKIELNQEAQQWQRHILY